MAEHPNLDDWKALAAKELKGAHPDDLVWQTPEGIPVKPLYTGADLEGLEHVDTLPGFEPFVRGVRHGSQPAWIRQYVISPPPSRTPSTAATLAVGQQGGRWPSTSPPPRLRPDHRVVGDVGKAGVTSTRQRHEDPLDGIPSTR